MFNQKEVTKGFLNGIIIILLLSGLRVTKDVLQHSDRITATHTSTTR